jgi:hypothetical protein
LQVSAPGQATTSRADEVEAGVQLGELLLGQVPVHDVLAVGDPDLQPEVALDGGQGPELLGGHVAQAGVGVGRDGALGVAPDDVGVVPAAVGVAAGDGHVRAPAHRRGADGRRHAGRLVAGSADRVGDAPGPGRRGGQEAALLEDPAADLVGAQRVDQPLHPGPQLVVTVAGVVERPQDGLDGGQQVLAGGELLQGLGRVGVGAKAAGEEDSEAGLDRAVVLGPVDGHDADVVEHGLAAVGDAPGEVDLELAGQALGVGVAQQVLEGGLGPR